MMRFVVKTASMEKNLKHASDGMKQPCSTIKISSMRAWRVTPLSGTGKLPTLSHENFESAPLCCCPVFLVSLFCLHLPVPLFQLFCVGSQSLSPVVHRIALGVVSVSLHLIAFPSLAILACVFVFVSALIELGASGQFQDNTLLVPFCLVDFVSPLLCPCLCCFSR